MATRRHLAPWGRAAAAARAVAAGGDQREVLAALEGKPALYHCISRVVDRSFRLGPAEKQQFVLRMRKLEAFCKVRVLTFCVMSNHFHLLVEVPERPSADPTDAELLDHLATLYGGGRLAEVRWELEQHRQQGNHAAAEALRQRFLRRMWDLSAFLQALKHGFSVWFNRRHERKGCLWEERFKSVLVEDGHAARVVAGYIDLNPVRAAMVKAAADYRWSGYGEAVAGKPQAREGLRQVMLERELARSGPRRALHDVADWKEVLAGYRKLLAEDAGRRPAHAGNAAGGERAREGRPVAGKRAPRPAPPGRGRLSEAELLHRRVRYFADGMVVGSGQFVDAVFGLTRGCFGARRSSGARPMAQAETSLRTMRALQVDRYG